MAQMQLDELHGLLVENDVINDDARPNSSHQFAGVCWDCAAKKMYVNADEDDEDRFGLWKCQHCGIAGNLQSLLQLFGPVTDEQRLYRAFHELSVRSLLKNKLVLSTLLEQRDFTEEDIATFGFGYVGKGWTKELIAQGFTTEQFREHGFLTDADYPVFWNHIIIPYRKQGAYENFKGRCLDENPKLKYIWLIGKEVGLFQSSNLHRSGRIFLTEGEFKVCYAQSNGYNSVGISGAGNFKKHLKQLNACNDLWIVYDADEPSKPYPRGCGQETAEKLAQNLDRCHVVKLPYVDKKVGWDDYLMTHTPEQFEALCQTADLYIDGEKQKSQSLAVVVGEWAARVLSAEQRPGFQLGFDRLQEWTRGFDPGTLWYLLGAPHHGKSVFERTLAYNLYQLNPDLFIDYHSNDDSLRVTIAQFIAMIGELNAADARQPLLSYANDKESMKRWQKALADFQAMSGRFKLVDRSFRIDLDDLYEEMMRWREKDENAQRILIVDGFNKIYMRDLDDLEGQKALIVKSDRLKLIAQEANIGVLVSIDPPKMHGKRPTSGDIAGSAAMEFDADVILSTYIEAQSKGLQGTNLKIIWEYEDEVEDTLPIIELAVHKNKQTGHNDLDLFVLHKNTSFLEELEDRDYASYKREVFVSQTRDNKSAYSKVKS